MKKSVYNIFIAGVMILYTSSCRHDYTPKPRGYMKIDYPAKNYILFDEKAPFTFNYPDYAKIEPDTSINAEPFWYNILFPEFDGTIYLSYKELNKNLSLFIEDSRSLVYKHSIKAESIDESLVSKPEIPLYGIIYDLKGNTASSLQFFLTDSIRHFLRGSLYFNTPPEKDSLAPVIAFIRQDVEELVNSFKWEEMKK